MKHWFQLARLSVCLFGSALVATFADTSPAAPKPLLAGLIVNQQEQPSIDAYRLGDDYYMPLATAIAQIGIEPTRSASGLAFTTPLGAASIANTAVRRFQQQDYIALGALKAIGVGASFNQSAYAVQMIVPWDKQKLGADASQAAEKQAEQKSEPTIDYYPQTAGISEISLSGGYTWQRNDSEAASWTRSLTLGTSGALLGGTWGSELRWDDSNSASAETQKATLDNLYWTTAGEHSAIRLGINTPAYDTGGTGTYTGVSLAYSNHAITRHLTAPNSNTDTLIQSNYQDYRTISGKGPVGGIAELRINGNAVARVRIALDERYEFINLDVDELYDNEYNIEIALYEHDLNTPPIRVIPYRLGKRRANVGTGEWLLEGGGGHAGNLFDDENSEQGHYAYGYAEYGISNDVAVRMGASDSKDERPATTAGINIGLSPALNWDLAYWDSSETRRYASELDYTHKTLNLNYQYSYNQTNDDATVLQRHRLYANYRPTQWLRLSSNAYYASETDEADEKYFTVTANAKLNKQLTAQLHRNRDNDYSYRLNWRPDYRYFFSVSGDKEKDGLYARYRLSQQASVGGSVQKARGEDDLFYQAYADYAFNEKHKLYAAYNTYRSHSGYQVDWQYRVNRGLHVYLGYRRNQQGFNTLLDDSDESWQERDYFYLRFNLDLSNTPAAGYQFKPHHYRRKGAVLADIQYDSDIPIDSEDIALQLNQRQATAQKLADGKYLIEGISPGVYALTLDSKNLPIEYGINEQPKVMIKVGNAATTVVPYHLQKSLGVSGKLDNTAQSLTVSAYLHGEAVASTTTNAFGYYQLLGLKPGTYEIRASGYQPQRVKVDKTFLFEVNLQRLAK